MSVKQHLLRFIPFALAVAFLLPVSAWAQDVKDNNKFEIFGGYSWLHPGGTVAQTPFATGETAYTAPTINLHDLNRGWGLDATFKFKPWFGVKAAGNGHYSDASDIHTAMVGPVFTLPLDHMNLFAEGLYGFSHMAPSNLASSNGAAVAAGGGIDLWLSRRIAWRVIQADYVRQNLSNSDVGQTGKFNGARLQAGIVFGLGSLQARKAAAAACTVSPSEATVGEPISANVVGSNFNPKHSLNYEWSGTGVSGTSSTVTIATRDLTPGTHTITAKVSDRKDSHAVASCTAQFTLKPLPPKNPPVLSCAANPSSVVAGTAARVDCTCTSPDGVGVNVADWKASAGSVRPEGNSASIDTTDVTPGSVTVSAACTDVRGLSTPASVMFAVAAPAPKVNRKLEARLALHSVYFQTAKPTAKEPTVGLLRTQEKTLRTLADDFATYREAVPDAHLVLVGHADIRGTAEYNQALTERRVAIVKGYLVDHGVPESVIETKPLGAEHNLTPAEVRASVESDSTLTQEQKARILRNMRLITLASNRRVDITLKAAGMLETSKREFPFNGADSLTLLGNEPAKKPVAHRPIHRKATKKK